jgi:hypothetical protein
MTNLEAATIASRWYYGMFSCLYRFQCLARKSATVDMDRDLLAGCLKEIKECVDDLTYGQSKEKVVQTDFLIELDSLKNFISSLLLETQSHTDTV